MFMAQPDRLALALDAQVLDLPADGAVVVLRAAPSAFLDQVPPDQLRCEQTFRPLFDALSAQGIAVERVITGPAALVVINITRTRAESLGLVARGLAMLAPGGMLAVNGAKTDGIDSIARQTGAAIPVTDVFVKAHGRVVVIRKPERLPDAVDAWTQAAAASRTAAGLVTAPGLFSSEGPDPGSEALVDHLDSRMSGRVADLGAGWGYLAHAALARAPGITHLDLFEAEALALDAARENVDDPRAAFHWADATRPDPHAELYDAVITNPPFHAGRAAEPEIGAAFVHAAARRLKPKGRLYLVANRQLPYEAPLDEAFVRHQRLYEDGRYKVILAERPRRRP